MGLLTPKSYLKKKERRSINKLLGVLLVLAQSSSYEIDQINILEATMLAMKRAVEQLKIELGNR